MAAKKFSVGIYEIQIIKKKDSEGKKISAPISFDSLNRPEDSYLVFMHGLITKTLKRLQSAGLGQGLVFGIKGEMIADGQFLSGWFNYGEYGASGSVVSVSQKKVNAGAVLKSKKRIERNEAVLNEFFFEFFLPSDISRAYFCLQRYGGKSAYSVINTEIEKEFKKHVDNDEYHIEFKLVQPFPNELRDASGKRSARYVKMKCLIPQSSVSERGDEIEGRPPKEVMLKAELRINLGPLDITDAVGFFKKNKNRFYEMLPPSKKNISEELFVKYGDDLLSVDLEGDFFKGRYYSISEKVSVKPQEDISSKEVLGRVKKETQGVFRIILKAKGENFS